MIQDAPFVLSTRPRKKKGTDTAGMISLAFARSFPKAYAMARETSFLRCGGTLVQ